MYQLTQWFIARYNLRLLKKMILMLLPPNITILGTWNHFTKSISTNRIRNSI